jgi:hypothetical protein
MKKIRSKKTMSIMGDMSSFACSSSGDLVALSFEDAMVLSLGSELP